MCCEPVESPPVQIGAREIYFSGGDFLFLFFGPPVLGGFQRMVDHPPHQENKKRQPTFPWQIHNTIRFPKRIQEMGIISQLRGLTQHPFLLLRNNGFGGHRANH